MDKNGGPTQLWLRIVRRRYHHCHKYIYICFFKLFSLKILGNIKISVLRSQECQKEKICIQKCMMFLIYLFWKQHKASMLQFYRSFSSHISMNDRLSTLTPLKFNWKFSTAIFIKHHDVNVVYIYIFAHKMEM